MFDRALDALQAAVDELEGVSPTREVSLAKDKIREAMYWLSVARTPKLDSKDEP